jgi:hypothetical protein
MLDKASYRSEWKEKQNWYKRNNYWDYVITSEDHPGGRGGTVYADEIRETARVKILGKK